jgi:hypothetical protein
VTYTLIKTATARTSRRTVIANSSRIGSVENLGRTGGWVAFSNRGDGHRSGFAARELAAQWLADGCPARRLASIEAACLAA